MNKKEFTFLDNNLLELLNNNIISDEQYAKAKEYFFNNKKGNNSTSMIFISIGVLLIALSIITIFAINWENISKIFKVLISFIPLVITAILLYIYMSKNSKKVQLYTSIFAPIGIIATNSLIAQIFHIQTGIEELFFTSLIMFLPIVFVLRNYTSIAIYGVGTIIYTASLSGLFKTLILLIPIIIYNIVNYIKNKDDNKNILMWVINVCAITILLFAKEVFRFDIFLIYLYMVYIITKTLFGKDNGLNKVLSSMFIIYLIISCIDPFMVSYVEEIEFGYDTLLVTVLTLLFIFLSKTYKEPKEYFIFLFIILMQFIKIDTNILFIIINILSIALGVYKIIAGNKESSYEEIRRGISIILLIILFRFINSSLNFAQKSIMFLITGACFIIVPNIVKKRIGGGKNE